MNITEFLKIFNNVALFENKVILKNNLAKTVRYVKDNYGYDMLKEITAVENEDMSVELNYNLYSSGNDEDLILSINVNHEAESIADIFDSASADENEIYDLFGINFIGNDDLKRLYMSEGWIGHPLRKEYEDNDERLRWND